MLKDLSVPLHCLVLGSVLLWQLIRQVNAPYVLVVGSHRCRTWKCFCPPCILWFHLPLHSLTCVSSMDGRTDRYHSCVHPLYKYKRSSRNPSDGFPGNFFWVWISCTQWVVFPRVSVSLTSTKYHGKQVCQELWTCVEIVHVYMVPRAQKFTVQ